MHYQTSSKYTDLATVYEQCSGPGGLKLSEFMAEKMGLQAGARMADIGIHWGYQTCFLAKEYGVNIVAIDPGDTQVDRMMRHAADFGVVNQVIGVKSALPNSLLPSDCFDFVHCTNTLEMIRGGGGKAAYLAALKEIHRILKPGGVFGLGEPMHLDAPAPAEFKKHLKKNGWDKCFATLAETKRAAIEAGFAIIEADYCEEAQAWWEEYATYDLYCAKSPTDAAIIREDNGRWLSFGYVIAKKKGDLLDAYQER